MINYIPPLPMESDLDELEALLLGCPDEDNEAMALSELDGFLAGVLVSPHPIPQTDWLRVAWGGAELAYPADPERSARLERLILDRKAEIEAQFRVGGLVYLPVFDVDDSNGDVLWETWMEGFSRTMNASETGWERLLKSRDEDLVAAAFGLTRYAAIARGVVLGDVATDLEDSIFDEVSPEEVIPYLVETLYRRQNRLRRVVLSDGLDDFDGPVTRPKIGRNEPCPCGSGKKYKKCCGA